MSASLIVLILAFLVLEAGPALRSAPLSHLLSAAGWHPTEGKYGMLPLLVGSLLTTAGALSIAAPVGIAAAVFGQFYAPSFVAIPFRHMIALLGGIPSVVYGLFGLVVLAPRLATLGGSGQCLLAAILILGLMILPTVTLTTLAALRSVPTAYLRGAAALGLGRYATARRVALPAARSGIVTGLFLATARAAGETMAVLMVAGNVVQIPRSLLDPTRTLTANIALELGYADPRHRALLFAGGLLLMLAVLALLLLTHRRPARFRGLV